VFFLDNRGDTGGIMATRRDYDDDDDDLGGTGAMEGMGMEEMREHIHGLESQVDSLEKELAR